MTEPTEAGEVPLTDGDEKLYRQVHPTWIQKGELTFLAFRPGSGDAGKVSISRGSMTTPEAAYALHTGRGLASAGTWGITVGQLTDAEIQGLAGRTMTAYGQPCDDDDAHGFIDYRGLTRKVAERVAKVYKARATCEHDPS